MPPRTRSQTRREQLPLNFYSETKPIQKNGKKMSAVRNRRIDSRSEEKAPPSVGSAPFITLVSTFALTAVNQSLMFIYLGFMPVILIFIFYNFLLTQNNTRNVEIYNTVIYKLVSCYICYKAFYLYYIESRPYYTTIMCSLLRISKME